MKFFRFICFHILFLLTCTLLMGQENFEIQKSAEAIASDSLYEVFTKEGFKPEKQLLDNTFSEDFPYNIIIRPSTDIEENTQIKKKIIIVFPQQDAILFLENCINFISAIENKIFSYTLEFVFTANDKSKISTDPVGAIYSPFTPAGTTTYINSLETRENTAAIIIESSDTDSFFRLFDKIVELIPGGISSDGQNLIVSQGFFETIINGFIAADVPYFIRGQFLSLYQLGLVANNSIVTTWLESDVPAVALNATSETTANIFKTIESVLNHYADSDLSNKDTHYSLLQIFHQLFFISEQAYIIFLIVSTAIILFSFYNLSFIRGRHKNIHRQEFSKTWYFMPFIILLTGFFLFGSQYIIQILIPTNSSLPLFSLIFKIIFASLLLTLFSFIQYALKLPLTGFIYGYILSVSAFINIFIFAALEITLIPIFITEYLIVYFSKRVRKVIPLILCGFLMIVPYIPFILSLSNLDYVAMVKFITNASFSINLLFACILLPFQIMTIRILIRLKLWGKRRKITKKKLFIQSFFIFISIILLCIVSFFVPPILLEQKSSSGQEQVNMPLNNPIQVTTSQNARIGQNFNTLEISSTQRVVRYHIEISSKNPIPVFDANYPYDILQKPFTAVFELDEYPPEPFVLTFTTKDLQDTLCSITAWIQTDAGIQKTEVEHTIVGISE